MARQSGTVVAEKNVAVETAAASSLSREQLVEFYRLMYLSRRTDDREIVSEAAAEDLLPGVVCGA